MQCLAFVSILGVLRVGDWGIITRGVDRFPGSRGGFDINDHSVNILGFPGVGDSHPWSVSIEEAGDFYI